MQRQVSLNRLKVSARENILWGKLFCVYVRALCCFMLLTSLAPHPGHMRKKKSQGTQYHVVPQLLRSTESLHSSPHFRVFLYLLYI